MNRDNVFTLTGDDDQSWQSRSLIIATGLDLRDIELPAVTRHAAIAAGTLRYCPVCDGYEHRGRRIAVVGSDTQGASEALFLRTYSDRVALFPLSHADLSEDERAQLKAAAIRVVTDPIERVEPVEDGIEIVLDNGTREQFDVLYPSLGCHPHAGLVAGLGLELNEIGKADASAPFGTKVPGLYCAGDVVEGLVALRPTGMSTLARSRAPRRITGSASKTGKCLTRPGAARAIRRRSAPRRRPARFHKERASASGRGCASRGAARPSAKRDCRDRRSE